VNISSIVILLIEYAIYLYIYILYIYIMIGKRYPGREGGGAPPPESGIYVLRWFSVPELNSFQKTTHIRRKKHSERRKKTLVQPLNPFSHIILILIIINYI